MQRLPGFDSKAHGLIELLTDYNWTGRVTSKGHWLGKAPDGKTTITVPSKMDNPSRAERNAKASFKKWVRDTFPEVAAKLDAAGDEDDPILRDILLESAHRKVTEVALDHLVKGYERQVEELLDSMEWPVRSPWMAHKQANTKGGVRYESEAVLQRLHEDGSVDYECAYEGPVGACGYTSENPRGVAVHYGRAHTMKGESAPASQDGPKAIDPAYTEPITERSYRPTDRLVSALADVLTTLNGHGTDQEKAEAILQWFHERPDIEHTTRTDVPLSDADILFRIRRLVAPTLDTDLTQARAELEVVKVERDLALAQLAKVSRDLDGIRELMTEVGR
jgi:hypothetical protein